MMSVVPNETTDLDELITFRLEANVNTYAAFMNETDSTRLDSHDYRYQNGEYTYKRSVNGAFEWFQGYEEIYWNDKKVYECFFHGGRVE